MADEVRIQIRATSQEKAFFKRLATECGFKTLSEFMRVSAHEKAVKELINFNKIKGGDNK